MRWSAVYVVAAGVGVAQAAVHPGPVALTEGQWLGNDGNWSTTEFMVGSPQQTINVLVSNSLSEFWAVGPSGCLPKEPHCGTARGGIFNPEKSKHWRSLGIWQLGLGYLGFGGNGEYGLDSINSFSPITRISFGMNNVLMAAINTTDYFDGLFGLGIIQGSFGNMVADSPLTQAVKTFGWIPSYTYGYTAGASYRNIPMSVTLGGYDTSRFKSHDISFTLPQADGIPRSFVRGIQVATQGGSNKPKGWDSDVQLLSEWNTSFTAMVDSSTPYLWLPEGICDSFAEALDLTYNDTFELYTLTDDQYQKYSQDDSFSFTFSLSSIDNSDDFGSPLDVPGVVNLTIPSRAFVSTLQYPFNDAIEYGDPAIPYFSLRRTQNSSTFIMGRSFLQESYLITKYDGGVFSLHEALFSESAELVAVQQPDDSPYPGPPRVDHGLTTAQMAGIAVAVVVPVALILLAGCCLWRRRRRRQRQAVAVVLHEHKDSTSSLTPDTPRTPISRILSRIRRRRSRKTATDVKQSPSEVPNSEIYELPAPVPPAELDGADDSNSISGETELGLENAQNATIYEQARRRMERQLRGPVPEYTPPSGGALPPPEKTIHDLGPADTQQTMEQPSPVSSPTRSPHSADGNTNPSMTMPSPLSPRGEGSGKWGDSASSNTGSGPRVPHPIITAVAAVPAPQVVSARSPGPTAMTRSDSGNSVSPISPSSASVSAPAAALQRTPIDPSKIVCLGPLPENVQLPRHNTFPRTPTKDDPNAQLPGASPDAHRSEDSLGSNFTEDEERMIRHMTRRQSPARIRSRSDTETETGGSGWRPQVNLQTDGLQRHQSERTEPDTPRSQERIDPGTELIHVPQMASKRYSWEE